MGITFAKLVLFSFSLYLYSWEAIQSLDIIIVDCHLLRFVLNIHVWKKNKQTTTSTSSNSTKKGTTSRRGKEQKICKVIIANNSHLFLQSVASQSPREQTRFVLSRCMSHCPLPLNCLSSVVLLPFQTGLRLCLPYTVSRWCWVLDAPLQSSWVSLTVHGKAQSSLVAWQ